MTDTERERLIQRAQELNTGQLDATEVKLRIREVCEEYLIEAKVNVDGLLKHEDWSVRFAALDIVWHGLGATDGIESAIDLLMHDPDEDVRTAAALALYEAGRGTANERQVVEALRAVLDDPQTVEYVRDAAHTYLCKLEHERDITT